MVGYGGTPFKIGDEEYLVPALSLGQLRSGLLEKLKLHDELVAEGKIFETMTLRGEVILAALRRNYPDFPEEKLFSFLDMANTSPMWLTVLGASGLGVGEREEPQAPAKPPNGTFGPSTEVSQPPTDGLTAR